jgi:hypothetical protein
MVGFRELWRGYFRAARLFLYADVLTVQESLVEIKEASGIRPEDLQRLLETQRQSWKHMAHIRREQISSNSLERKGLAPQAGLEPATPRLTER